MHTFKELSENQESFKVELLQLSGMEEDGGEDN